MATINVSKETSGTFYGAVTLGELRSFLAACQGIPNNARVRITTERGDQREGSSATIKVYDVAPPLGSSPYDR